MPAAMAAIKRVVTTTNSMLGLRDPLRRVWSDQGVFPMSTPSTTLAFHLSLSVTDIARSMTFYESLFGVPATGRQAADYAKFEVDEPSPLFCRC